MGKDDRQQDFAAQLIQRIAVGRVAFGVAGGIARLRMTSRYPATEK